MHDQRDLQQPYPSQEQIHNNTADFTRRNPTFKIVNYEAIQTTPVTIIPVYSCDLYNPITKECNDYKHRNQMCRDAGITYSPADNCLLWDLSHPKPKRFFFF